MINQQVVTYIQVSLAEGMSKEAITKSLLEAGWSVPVIEESFNLSSGSSTVINAINATGSTGVTSSNNTTHTLRNIVLGAIILFVVVAGVGGAYAYMKKIGPFTQPPYTEKNMVTGLLNSIHKIDTSSAALSFSFSVGPREVGAVPPVLHDVNKADALTSLFQLGDMLGFLSTDMKIDFSFGAMTDWRKEDNTDGKFSMDATGDLGDLSYKVNTEMITKDGILYFRINNIPSIALVSLPGIVKGSWYKLDIKDAISANLVDTEKTKIENEMSRKEFAVLAQDIAKIADQDQPFFFKSPPRKETIDGAVFYRYALGMNKENTVKFYEHMREKVEAVGSKSGLIPSGQALLDYDYIKSKEFSDSFDYYQKNSSFSLLVSKDGFPSLIEYTVRVVPQDSVEKFKDKQINMGWKISISDINKEVNIQAPADAKDIKDFDEVFKEKDKKSLIPVQTLPAPSPKPVIKNR